MVQPIRSNGRRYILYERLGTKALSILDGKVEKEWNRSYYQARRFDYPMCTAQLPNGRELLIHCPEHYNRLEIEDLSTGERLSKRSSESPDFFHSRLQVSADGKWLLSAGWFWHPLDGLKVFDLERVLEQPEALDLEPAFKIAHQDLEVQSAVFTPDSKLFIVTDFDESCHEPLECDVFWGLKAGQIGLFCPNEEKMLWVKDWEQPPGRVEIGGGWALSLFGHPKLYSLSDWSLVEEWPELACGQQKSSLCASPIPAMSFDLANNRFAISQENGIVVVSREA